MGILLNPNSADFQRALNSEIYVDKSMLIQQTNKVINTEQQFVYVSRPRRFGKSITANMLVAYYSRGCDTKEMFSHLKISKSANFEKHLNKYNVIHINMVEFLKSNIEETLNELTRAILFDVLNEYQDVNYYDKTQLVRTLKDIFASKKTPFVFIIDEWDSIFRIYKNDKESQTSYLNFLRNLLKDQSYVALAYMTGILPIKKYGEHSALNMFTEISMTDPRQYAEYTGFTEQEVAELCETYHMSLEDTKRWYNGYNLMGVSVYNPRSVVMSMTGGYFNNYWTSTETYEALRVYIEMNFDGLKEKITSMIAGERVEINTAKFQNDMTTLKSADDVLTLLIHLGYLTYSATSYTGIGEVWIPNSEVQQEFINSIEDGGWETVMQSIKQSDMLLNATLACDEQKVAQMIEQAHQDNTSVIKYNDENSLSCVMSLAYYSSRKDYIIHREAPAGKGYADLIFEPRKNTNQPAFIIELKCGKSADTALKQIKSKEYSDYFKDYHGEILFAGVNYDKISKKHTCKIEKSTI